MIEYELYLDALNEKEKNYIEERVIKQIEWMDEKSQKCQSKYKRNSIISTISTALIPIAALFYGEGCSTLISCIIALLGAMSTILFVINNLCEYQKLWIQYRSACESLKRELYYFFWNTANYDGEESDQKFEILVSNVEGVIAGDLEFWKSLGHNSKL